MLNLYVCSTIDYIGTSKSLLVRFPILFINEPHTYTLLALANAPTAGPAHKNTLNYYRERDTGCIFMT